MIFFTIDFSTKARKELIDAWVWYEDRQIGLGDRFVDEVFEKVRSLETMPERFPERGKAFRETKIAVFPYLVIYKISKRKKKVIVASIFHTRRSPQKKK